MTPLQRRDRNLFWLICLLLSLLIVAATTGCTQQQMDYQSRNIAAALSGKIETPKLQPGMTEFEAEEAIRHVVPPMLPWTITLDIRSRRTTQWYRQYVDPHNSNYVILTVYSGFVENVQYIGGLR